MDMITIFVIAFGLAMDAFAVSITSGTIVKHPKINNSLKINVFWIISGGHAVNGVVSGV